MASGGWADSKVRENGPPELVADGGTDSGRREKADRKHTAPLSKQRASTIPPGSPPAHRLSMQVTSCDEHGGAVGARSLPT